MTETKMNKPRRAIASITYNGKNIDGSIRDFVTAFKYEDVASGSSDSISLEVNNRSGKWLTSWFPRKGDKIKAKIRTYNWEKADEKKVFNCGTFTLDDCSFDGPPVTGNIGAIAAPAKDSFTVTKNTKTWKDVTVKGIAEQIAKKSNLKLVYEAGEHKIKSMEQNDKTDSEFLKSLCEERELALKIFAGKIVIFDEAKYEKKKAVATLTPKRVISWGYNMTLTGSYSGGELSYTDAKTKKTIKVKVGKGKKILKLNDKVDSEEEGRKKLCAEINKANKESSTMSITIMANQKIVASSCVNLKGWHSHIDGKYYVDKITHTVGTGNYTMDLEMHKVFTRITK